MIDKRKTNSRILKYPVLKNVEYATIKKKGKVVLELPGSEIKNDITWRDFQKLIGSKIGSGNFYFTIKFKNNAELYTGRTNAVDLEGTIDSSSSSDNSEIIERFKLLEDKLEKSSKGDFNLEQIQLTLRLGYENQLNFKDLQIADLKSKLDDLKKDLDGAEEDLSDCEKVVKDLEGKTGIQKYLEIGEKLLQAKLGRGAPPVSLKDSDPTDIPPEILEIIGAVDWQKIDPDGIETITRNLKQYISFFPMKGAN